MRFGPRVYHNIPNRNARLVSLGLSILFALWFIYGIIDAITNTYEKMNFFSLSGLNCGLQAAIACFFIYRLLVKVYDIPRLFTRAGAEAFRILAIELGSLWLAVFIVVLFTPFGALSGSILLLAVLSYFIYRILLKVANKVDSMNANMGMGDFNNIWRMFR